MENSKQNLEKLLNELNQQKAELERKYDELHENQNELLRLKNRYQELFDFAPVSYFLLDQNMVIRNVNHKGAELFETTRENIVNRKLDQFINQNSHDTFNWFFRALIKGNVTKNIDVEITTVPGNLIIGHVEYFQAISDDDSFIRLAITDITKSVNEEREIILRETLYRQLFENIGNGIAVFRPIENNGDFVFNDLNSTAQSMLRVKKKNVIGKRLSECFPAIDNTELPDFLREVNSSGSPSSQLKNHYHDDDLDFWFDSFAYKMPSGLIVLIFQDITTQKITEDAYKIGQEQFRAAFENAAIAITITDIDGNYQNVNSAFCSLTGYTLSELLQKSFYDITHPEDVDLNKIYAKMLVQLQTEVVRMEKRYIRKDGTIIWVNINASLVFDLNSQPMYFIQQIIDVSRQKQLVADLESSRSKLAAILDNTRQIFILFDQGFKITGFNREADFFITRNLGRSLEAGASIIDILKALDINLPLETFEQVFNNRIVKQEVNFINNHKHKQWFELELIPIRNELDEVTGICFNASNITQRKHAESELAEQNQFMQLLLNALPMPVFFKDELGKYRLCNDAMLDFLNKSKEEIIGKTVFEIYLEEEANIFYKADKELLDQRGHQSYQTKVVDGRGVSHDILFNKALVEGSDGETLGLLGVMVDITDRNKATEALKRSEEAYRTLIANQGEGIGTTDIHEQFTFVNPAAEEIFGVMPGQLIGKSLFEFLNPDSFNKIVEETDKKRFGGRSRYDLQIIRPDGEKRDLFVTSTPIFDSNKVLSGAFGVFRDVTELKKMQESIFVSEKKYRGLFQSITDGINQTNLEGQILDVNKSFIAMLGYETADDLIGLNYRQITPEKWHNLEHDIFNNQIFPQGYSEVYEKEYIRKDGSIFPVSIKVWLIRDEKGVHTGLWGIVRDITDKKKAETAIRLYEKQLQVRNQIAHVFLTQTDHQIFVDVLSIALNSVESKFGLFGYIDENGDLVCPSITRDVWETCQLPDKNIVFKKEIWAGLWGRSLKAKTTLFTNDVCNTPAGHIMITRALNVPIIYQDQAIGNFLVGNKPSDYTNEDIEILESIAKYIAPVLNARLNRDTEETKRILAENEIYKLSQAVEQSPNAIAIADPSGEIIYVNHKFHEITGYYAEDVLNKKMAGKFIGASTNDEFQRICEQVNRFGEWRGELLNFYKNGDAWWEWITLSGIRDKNENVIQYVLIMDDISERKKMEIELIHAKEKAEESNRLKSHFLDNMSHEIRTPLNAILGFSQILQMDNQTEEERMESISTLVQSSDNLLKIISDIIDLSKIEGSTIELNKTRFSVDEVINEISYEIPKDNNGMIKKEVAFNCLYDKTDKTILYTDKDRLKKAISYVIDNAIKFTHKGFVEFGAGKQINRNMVFYVKDTGIGIPPDKRHIIFERFRQVDDSSTRKYGGLGIGLTIAAALIRQIGGNIWFDSEEGKGSVFYISFPVIQQNVDVKNPEFLVPDISTRSSFKGFTILIADDNLANVELLRTYLQRRETQVLIAKDGREAIDLCNQHPEIALVLMDLQMPVVNGLEATRAIRKLRKNLPIIAQTAYSLGFNMKDALDAGCNDYIVKPIKLSTLEAKISALLKQL